MNLLESLPTAIGAAAVAPALLVLWMVIAADERPGPPSRVWAAFALGAASISLLAFARRPSAPLLHLSDDPWRAMALHSVFSVAAPEELVKVLAIVAISVWRRPHADPMDPVVYGAAAGLGFAAYENLAYLIQYPEMWRTLAVLRSVLTVPFHGALGIIAGAYLAISRSPLALGAHRHERNWARNRMRLSVLLAPVALHAGFDFPLLVLREQPELSAQTGLMMEGASVLVGFGTICFAAYLVRRIGKHHAPRTDVSRAKLRHLRRMWALLVGGGGAGFAGIVFLLTAIKRWWITSDAHFATALVPAGFISIAIGGLLLAFTAATYMRGRNRLRETASALSGG